MRIFNNFKDLDGEVERDLKEMGIEYTSRSVQDKKGQFVTKELIGYTYRITSLDKAEETLANKQTAEQLAWMEQELQDRIYTDYRIYGPDQWNPGRAWEFNREFWDKFRHKNGKFSYTYAERWRPQIHKVIQLLKERPDSRHGIIEMWDSGVDAKNVAGRKRVPCSMHYQFLVRNDEMHIIYVMRSCDFKKFFLMDLYMTWLLGEYIAEELGIKVASLTHTIGSLHAFAEDMKEVF